MSRNARQTFKQRQFGVNTKVHIFASGKQRVQQSLVPSWFAIKRPAYIEVPSFDRFAFVKQGAEGEELKPTAGGPDDRPEGDTFEMFRKPPTEHMLQTQCDACAGPHNSKNLRCSATLGVVSPYASAEPGIYDIRTREKVKNIAVVDEAFAAHAKVSKVTLQSL
jgi:hypothetical protein